MAPGTGAKRLLGPYAKTTSAGLCLALVAAAFVLAGCGGGSDGSSSTATGGAESSGQTGAKRGAHIAVSRGTHEQEPASKKAAKSPVADIALTSPVIHAANGDPGHLSDAYDCDGQNSWPALHWSALPANTAELALFAMSQRPYEGELFIDWAVAGLNPDLDGIQAGKLPKGAIVGENSFQELGYSICAPRASETYVFALYALPRRLSPEPGFDALALRREVLDVSGDVGFLPAVASH